MSLSGLAHLLPAILALTTESGTFHIRIVECVGEVHYAVGIEAVGQAPGVPEFVDSLSEDTLTEEG